MQRIWTRCFVNTDHRVGL